MKKQQEKKKHSVYTPLVELQGLWRTRNRVLDAALPRRSAGTLYTLFSEGDEYYQALKKDIMRASSTIYIEVYILEMDRIGEPLLELLHRRATEGLDVRLLVDGVGSFRLLQENESRVRSMAFSFRVYRPVKAKTMYHLLRSHRRNHRKLIAIDGEICYLGGMNIKEAHSKTWSGVEAWQDSMIRLEGAVAQDARANFLLMWDSMEKGPLQLARSFHKRVVYRRDFLIVENIPIVRRIRYRMLFLAAMRMARNTLYIQTAYFVPRLYFIRGLRRLASSGVDVRIILNSRSDVRLAKWAGRAIYALLLKKGVRIYERDDRFSHAKVAVFDNRLAIVGSTNLDYRSFMHNLEVDVITRRIDVCEELQRRFLDELLQTREIYAHQWRKRPYWWRIVERIAYLFRYWL